MSLYIKRWVQTMVVTDTITKPPTSQKGVRLGLIWKIVS